MTIQVRRWETEGFLTGLGIQTESGMLLRFTTSPFNGAAKRREQVAEFREFIESLERLGATVVGKERIPTEEGFQ